MRQIVAVVICAALAGSVMLALAQDGPMSAEQTAGLLRDIHAAFAKYSAEHRAFMPPDLGKLQPYLPREFPLKRVQQDFVYGVLPGTKQAALRGSPYWPVVIQKPAKGDPLMAVLFADGHVQRYAPATGGAGNVAAVDTIPSVPPPPPTTPPAPADAAPVDATKLVGAWRTRAGNHDAEYHFGADGTYTLTFEIAESAPESLRAQRGPGVAAGKWTLQGRRLSMTHAASSTPFSVVGETEQADVVRADEAELVLKTTDGKNNPEEVKFARTIPFQRGKRDNEQIVGTWTGDGTTLVLANSGVAVHLSRKGEWAQQGERLTVRLEPMPQDWRPRTLGDRVPEPGAPPNAGAAAARTLEFTIDVLDDTTLVLTPVQKPEQPPRPTLTLLRVK